MAYILQGGNESLLGQRDGVALGIINFDLQGSKPKGQNGKQTLLTQATQDHCEKVLRMEMLTKQDPAIDKMDKKTKGSG